MATTTTRETEDPDDKVHELVDIITEEVSDVDRAANRRTYLVVKRDEDIDEDDPLGPELMEGDDGTFRTVGKAEDEDDEEEEEEDDEEDAKPRKGKPTAAPGEAARKQALSLPAPVKQALLRALAGVLERLTAVVASIKDAEETSDKTDRPMPDSVARELRGIHDALAKLLDRYPAKVTKAGAKLAEKRRRQLQSAIDLLQKLLAEVLPAEPHAEPAGAPSSIAAMSKAHGSAGPAHDLANVFTSLAEGIGALTAKVKNQDAEIARLKKSTGVRASREVDAPRAPKAPEPVSWPLDMNAPLTREQISKDVSFFDD